MEYLVPLVFLTTVGFSVEENTFGVTPDPLGGTQGAQGGPGGYTNSQSNEKMLLINVVAYVSAMTKMHFESSPNPLG